MADILYPDFPVVGNDEAEEPPRKKMLRPIHISKLFPHGKPALDHECHDMLRMLALCAHEIASGLDEE